MGSCVSSPDAAGANRRVVAVADHAVEVAKRCEVAGAALVIGAGSAEEKLDGKNLETFLEVAGIKENLFAVTVRGGTVVCQWKKWYWSSRGEQPRPVVATSAGDVAVAGEIRYDQKHHTVRNIVYRRGGGVTSRYGACYGDGRFAYLGDKEERAARRRPARVWHELGIVSKFLGGSLHGSPAVRCPVLEVWAENGRVGRRGGPALVGPAADGIPAVEAFGVGGVISRDVAEGPAVTLVYPDRTEAAYFVHGIHVDPPLDGAPRAAAELRPASGPLPPGIKELVDARVFSQDGGEAIHIYDVMSGADTRRLASDISIFTGAEKYARDRILAHRARLAAGAAAVAVAADADAVVADADVADADVADVADADAAAMKTVASAPPVAGSRGPDSPQTVSDEN